MTIKKTVIKFMNDLAKILNEKIMGDNPAIMDMLSNMGKELYMPAGIITQSAEAKAKAHKFNATIGIATEENTPMYLDCVHENLDSFSPNEIYPYAPTTGVVALRDAWSSKLVHDNPSLEGKTFGKPIVTNALTHGLSLIANLFINQDDYVVLSDKFWGNYRLTFCLMNGGSIATYATFDAEGNFNVDGLLSKVEECGKLKGKVLVVLNFPNNPTGYTPTTAEMKKIADGLTAIAESGIKVIAITDDAYFGLFHEDDAHKESIFSLLVERSKNLLAIKVDGATKETFVWGLRVGFITYGACESGKTDALAALEVKTAGAIRGNISNCTALSQMAVLRALQSDSFYSERQVKNDIIASRCRKVKEVLATGKYADEFTPYLFNSGYFMLVKLVNKNAEAVRLHLLDKYGVGVISTSSTDIRVAFSCLAEENVEELYNILYQACKEV